MSTTIKQSIDGFLLSCEVEGKSYRTIDCYSSKLEGFLPFLRMSSTFLWQLQADCFVTPLSLQ
jgi:hypothetical protein